MECLHCEEKFKDKSHFVTHCDWHTTIQTELRRPPGRTYGARYQAKKPTTTTESPAESVNPTLTRSSGSLENPLSKRLATAQVNPSANSNATASKTGADPQLQKILQSFPPYEGDGIEKSNSADPELKCRDCEFLFRSSKERDEHYLSKYCLGNAIVAYLMFIDSSHPGGYRVDKQTVPFDGQKSLFKCMKCDGGFGSEEEKTEHENSHSVEFAKCLHCQKIFSSQYELDDHYDWHDDMQYRHRRDAIRAAGSYSENLQTESGNILDPPEEVELPYGIRQIRNPWYRKNWIPRKDGDFVAISFISPEDLERAFALDGVFREAPDYYLTVPADVDDETMWEALAQKNTSSFVTSQNAEDIGLPRDKRIVILASGMVSGIENIATASGKGRTQSLPSENLNGRQSKHAGFLTFPSGRDRSEKGPVASGTNQAGLIQDTILEVSSEIANEDVISILDNIVKRAELGDLNDLRGLNKILASNKDLKDLGKDFLRWLDYENKEKGRIKTPKDPGARELRTQGHNFPAGYLVTDVSDRARFLTVEDYSLVIAGLVGSLADYKAQIRLDAFMTKAKLALSRGDLLEAEESYLHALGAAKEHAQAEILVLLKLATFYKDADIFDKAVDVYMQALSCSQRYYSKDSVNNFTILNSLAVLYGGRRRFEDAAALYRRSLAGLLKLEGPEHPDTLTTTQDLANMDQKLGHYRAAIALFEKAHAGFEKSSGSNDRMTLLTLSNLAAVYQSMGMHKKSRLLLEPAISRFRQALGLSDKLTISAACNLLPCCESSNIPDDTLAIFDCCRQTRDAFSLEALQCLGDFHAKHGLIENAAEMYKLVFEGRREVLGDTNPETLNALHVKASCSMRLDFLDEAKELFQLLLRLAQSISGPESQRWRRICSDALDNLRERQDALDNEAKSWGLGRLESCTATGCNQMTIRLCSGCKMVRYCSRGCENSNPSHRALCIPSVTPAQSFSIIIEGDCPEGIQDDVAILFTADSTIRSPPSVASSQCVHINPYNFVTLRLWKDTSKLVSFSFSPFADIRFAMVGSRPFKWYSPREVNHFYLSQGSSQFVLVAPGRQMLADLIARRSLPNGVERKSLELPDDDLIQYAQSAEPEKNKTMLAFVMIEWSI